MSRRMVFLSIIAAGLLAACMPTRTLPPSTADLQMLALDLYDVNPGYMILRDKANVMTPDSLVQDGSPVFAEYVRSLHGFTGFQTRFARSFYDFKARDVGVTLIFNQALGFESAQDAHNYLERHTSLQSLELKPIAFKSYNDESAAYIGARQIGNRIFDEYHALLREDDIVLVLEYLRTPMSDDMREFKEYVPFLANRLSKYIAKYSPR